MSKVLVVDAPTALPMQTRVIALEIETVSRAAKKNTKRVAGEDLPMSAFAYVGDEKKKATWKLPIKFSDDAKTKRHIRNAIAQFSKADLPDAEKKAAAWKRIVAAAKEHGIQVADENDSKKSAEDMQTRLAAEAADRKAKGEAEPDPEDEEDEEDQDDERMGADCADEDRFDMSFSSEAPVPRWFGDEILDHSAGCCDMTRASSGLAYLVDHNSGDQVGIIEGLKLDKKKLRGTVRFSRSQRAQDIKRDVQDGIRPFTSVGYRVMEMELEKEEGEGANKKRTYRVTRWMPMEGSTVAVPADTSVGAGRAAGKEEFPVAISDGKNVRSAAGDSKPQIHVEVKSMDSKIAAEILTLCTTHIPDAKRANAFYLELLKREGLTVDIASREILAEVSKNNGTQIRTPAAENSGKMIELTEREQKQYSLVRGIMAVVNNEESKGKSRESCFELEVSEEVRKTLVAEKGFKDHGGLCVPYRMRVDSAAAAIAREFVRANSDVLTRAGIATALAAGTTGQGKELVFTEPMEFIQFLYNQMKLKALGAKVISGLTGNVAFPKQTGRATGSWVGENPGTDVADSNLTLSQVTGKPHTYQTSTSYTRQLLAQAPSANIDIDSLVREDMARDAALAIDLAGINGNVSGSGNDPVGILNTSGVQTYTLENDSGNGAKPDYNDVVLMQEDLEAVNADQVGEPGWLTTPGIKAVLRRTPILVYTPPGVTTTVNVSGEPIWSRDGEVDGLQAEWSNQVPSNFTTGSGTTHALILGVFSALINGLWGSGFELVVDPYRLKKQGIIELTTFILTDWINRYPVAFVTATDCLKS